MTAPHLVLLGDAESVHLRRWAHEMLARGMRVSVVTARPGPIEGVPQRVLAPVHRPLDWLARVGAARRELERLAPDIVHAHYLTSYGYLAARAGLHPLVLTAWGSDLLVTPRRRPLVRWLTGWTLRRADLVTGDSADLLDAARAYRPRAALELVHWGADLDRFRPVPWGERQPGAIASLRSWEPNYRIDVVLAALARLRECMPAVPWRLHLLGGGSLEPALRARADALGLAAHVEWHGRVDDAAMAAVLARCTASVSVPESDATSVSVLESMAAGVPVVASDLPANRAWLDSGLLVAAGDAAALADALARLHAEPGRAEAIGAANRARIEREGSRGAQMDRMASLYRALLAPPRRSAR
jgi:glycosyltransferase involved in cell wall biosynthesis